MFNCAVGREEHCKQISLAYVGSARSMWTTLSLPPLMAFALRVYTAQAPGCSAGHCPKQALLSVHFPGLSCSGSRKLHKGTDSVHSVPFRGPSSSGNQVLGEGTVPGGLCILPPPLSQPLSFPGMPWECRLSCVSPLGSLPQAATSWQESTIQDPR